MNHRLTRRTLGAGADVLAPPGRGRTRVVRRTTVISLLALAPLLTACANEDLSSDAQNLRGDVAGMPGVSEVTLKYTKPVTLDSGKLQLDVTMSRDSTEKQVTAVGRTVYAAFSGTHDSEEGDVTLKRGDDTLHLRSFEPRASVDEVLQEWSLVGELADDGAVAVDINTQDGRGGSRLSSDIVLTLAEGSGPDDVDHELTTLASSYPDKPWRGWGVVAADGSGLTREPRFPTSTTRKTAASLQAAARSIKGASVAVAVREVAGKKGRLPIDTVTVTVTGESQAVDVSDKDVGQGLLAMSEDQSAVLRQVTETYTFSLVVDGTEVARIDPGICVAGEGELGPLDVALHTAETCPPEPSEDSP